MQKYKTKYFKDLETAHEYQKKFEIDYGYIPKVFIKHHGHRVSQCIIIPNNLEKI